MMVTDPYFQLVLKYAEPVKGHDQLRFFVNIAAKFKRVNVDTFLETGESVVFLQTLPLSFELLMKDDDTEARAIIDSLLEDLHLPSPLSFLTDHIIKSGRTMWRDYRSSYKFLGLKLDVDVFVDELPVDESSDEDQTTAVDIGVVAASKMAIEGLEKVRIDDDDRVV